MFQITLSEPTATLRWGKGGYKLFLQLVAKTNLSDLSVPPFNVTDCSSTNDLYLPPGKYKQLYMNTFGYSSVKIWNTLSANIRESTSLKDFKRKYLTNYFLTSNK